MPQTLINSAVPVDDGAALLPLDPERLDCYHVAVEFQVLASTLLPVAQRVLRDQLERASVSIVLNISEAMVPHCLRSTTFRRKETAGDGK